MFSFLLTKTIVTAHLPRALQSAKGPARASASPPPSMAHLFPKRSLRGAGGLPESLSQQRTERDPHSRCGV